MYVLMMLDSEYLYMRNIAIIKERLKYTSIENSQKKWTQKVIKYSHINKYIIVSPIIILLPRINNSYNT